MQKDFVNELLDCLKERASGNITFEYTQVIKANDTPFDAIIVRRSDSPVGKNIYLNELLNRFSKGESVEDIANHIIWLCNRRESVDNITADALAEQMKDWKYLLDGNISLRLINRERSIKYLEGKTYLPFLDLAIVFCINIDGIIGGVATAAIPREIAKCWGIGLEDALKQALEIIKLNSPVVRRPLKDIILEHAKKTKYPDMTEDFIQLLCSMDTKIYVQTNEKMLNGAITMLYTDSLSELCKELETDALYVIPSSLHEVLLLNKSEMPGGVLKSMVLEVNATQVASEEILSDNIYIYDDTTKEVKIWKEN